jgi:GTPase SAR1 family protein
MVVLDLARREIYENLDYWVGAIRNITPGVPLIILGNKSDLEGSIQVSQADLEKISRFLSTTWFMTSANTGERVEEAFGKLDEFYLRGVSNG